nr:hypothetical protein HK105_005426 [Polyrhizophydium stewartii]
MERRQRERAERRAAVAEQLRRKREADEASAPPSTAHALLSASFSPLTTLNRRRPPAQRPPVLHRSAPTPSVPAWRSSAAAQRTQPAWYVVDFSPESTASHRMQLARAAHIRIIMRVYAFRPWRDFVRRRRDDEQAAAAFHSASLLRHAMRIWTARTEAAWAAVERRAHAVFRARALTASLRIWRAVRNPRRLFAPLSLHH